MRAALLVWPALALAISASAAQASTGFSQGNFNAADWQQQVQTDDGVAQLTWQVVDGFGNPGQYWQITYQVPATTTTHNSADRVANVYQGFSYDPGVSGALTQMDFSLDARGIGNTFSFSTLGYLRPAIQQGGAVYTVASSDFTVTLGLFSTQTWSFSASDNWLTADGSAALPDFSAAGAPLQFGFRFAHFTQCTSAAGCRGGATFTGVDNFSVQLTSAVPEPHSAALLLAGLACVGGLARRWGTLR